MKRPWLSERRSIYIKCILIINNHASELIGIDSCRVIYLSKAQFNSPLLEVLGELLQLLQFMSFLGWRKVGPFGRERGGRRHGSDLSGRCRRLWRAERHDLNDG